MGWVEIVGAVAVDRDGNLYIAGGNRIRLVTPSGIITTIAGSFDFGSGGDGGLATLATLGLPTAVTADASGNVYIADTNNHRIRKATLNVPAQLDLVSGNNQTGAAGTTLPDPLVVQLTGTAGAPVFGVPVVYAVTSGDATLSATNTNTSLDGTAGIAVTLGAMLGTITVSASVANLPAAVFTLTAVEKAGTGQQPGNASGGSRTRSRAISYLLECQLCLIP